MYTYCIGVIMHALELLQIHFYYYCCCFHYNFYYLAPRYSGSLITLNYIAGINN